jgi:hypothetical protein
MTKDKRKSSYVMTPEHKANLSLAHRGRHPSLESKQKMSKAQVEVWKRFKENHIKRSGGGGHNKGKPAYNRGIKHPSEVIQNIRIGMKRYWKQKQKKKKKKQSAE